MVVGMVMDRAIVFLGVCLVVVESFMHMMIIFLNYPQANTRAFNIWSTNSQPLLLHSHQRYTSNYPSEI